MRILFLDNNTIDNKATLVWVIHDIEISTLNDLEKLQEGTLHNEEYWRQILEDGKIDYVVMSEGNKSDYNERDYDIYYTPINRSL